MPLDLVLSPYDLTARSAVAVAACLLGDRVITLMPGPGRDLPRDPASLARHGSPAFDRLADAWAWSGPLWRSGVLSTGMDGDAALEALRTAREGIDRDPALSPLATLMSRTDPDDHDARQFEAICRDLVTGGINPSVTVPLGAAVESYAAENALTIVRGAPRSVVGRLEKANERVVFRLSVLSVTEADADDLVHLRGAIRETAAPFRAALTDLLRHTRSRANTGQIADALGAADAHRAALDDALEDRVNQLRSSAGFSGQRLKLARLTLTGACREAGTGVLAARRAADVLENRTRTDPAGHRLAQPAPEPGETALARAPLVVLTLKPASIQVVPGGPRLA